MQRPAVMKAYRIADTLPGWTPGTRSKGGRVHERTGEVGDRDRG
jgi:hypothetical protein